jgi:hypothetical protein
MVDGASAPAFVASMLAPRSMPRGASAPGSDHKLGALEAARARYPERLPACGHGPGSNSRPKSRVPTAAALGLRRCAETLEGCPASFGRSAI